MNTKFNILFKVESLNWKMKPTFLMVFELLTFPIIFSPYAKMIIWPSFTFFHISWIKIRIKCYFLQSLIWKFVSYYKNIMLWYFLSLLRQINEFECHVGSCLRLKLRKLCSLGGVGCFEKILYFYLCFIDLEIVPIELLVVQCRFPYLMFL